jgi:hypothetical protein
MPIAEKALAKIRKLTEDQHHRYAQALTDSIEWDREEDDIPPSPKDLASWHTLPLEALAAQFIILGKKEAHELLGDVGQPLGLPKLRKVVLTEQSYFRKFKRRPLKVSNKYVFTYAEVLELAGFNGEVSPPRGVRDLLNTR